MSLHEKPNEANDPLNPRLYLVRMGNFAARVAPETLLAAMNGKPWAVELIAEAYWPTAYRLAVTVLGHHGPDAEDAAQDATVSLTRGLARLADPSRVNAWGAVIAVRAAQRVRRRQENAAPLDDFCVASADGCCEDMLDMGNALRALPSDLRLFPRAPCCVRLFQ